MQRLEAKPDILIYVVWGKPWDWLDFLFGVYGKIAFLNMKREKDHQSI